MLKKIARNTFLLSASQIIARSIGFLYVIFLARVLGVEGFGTYSFTIALVYLLIPVADFGIERLVLRDIARSPESARSYFSRLLPLRIFLSIFAYLLAISMGFLLKQDFRQLTYLAIFGLAIIPNSLIFLYSSFLNAREEMVYMAGANIALIILFSGLGTAFALAGLGLPWILFAYPLANFLVASFFVFRSRKLGFPNKWEVDFDFWRKSLSQSWVFGAILILAVFYLRSATVIVNFFKGPQATGLYSSASRFIEAMVLIPQSLALALFPLSSKLIEENKEKLKQVYLKGLGVLLLFSLPFALSLFLGSRLIINIAYKEEFLPATGVFLVLGFSVVFFFVNALAGTIIQNSNKVKKFLPLALSNFLVLLVLLLILVPRYSIVGAAWAVVGGEIFGLIVNNVFIYQILKENPK